MPRGALVQYLRALFGQKRTSIYIFRQKCDHYYTQTRHSDLSHYNLFLGTLREKSACKARVNTDASISDRAHAPWASYNTV